MHLRQLLLLMILALASLAPMAASYAGAWVQPAGGGEIILNATAFESEHYFNGKGDRTAQPAFRKYELQPYLEYGVSPNWTLGASAGLQSDAQSGREHTGIADPELFARVRLWSDEKQVFSAQPLIKFESAFSGTGAPRGGSDSTDLELSLLYGRTIHWFSDRDYLDLRLGYRTRLNALHDQLRADAALGLWLDDRWQLIPAIRGTFATGRRSSAGFVEDGSQDYDLLRLELGAAYDFNPTQRALLTLFDHVDGRYTGTGQGVTLGFLQRF